ncbi:MAG TPA: hypothetical protein VHM70_19150 [Polyangiaceae bacterium]|jgi:hypothetical protein|nr:hypothetical protein [Polyangiaceae bacterium]
MANDQKTRWARFKAAVKKALAVLTNPLGEAAPSKQGVAQLEPAWVPVGIQRGSSNAVVPMTEHVDSIPMTSPQVDSAQTNSVQINLPRSEWSVRSASPRALFRFAWFTRLLRGARAI